MIKKIEFRAFIPAIMSAIRTGGDGLRLTLDVPESDVQDCVALIALRNCPLRVTIEVDNSPVATRVRRPADTTIADEKQNGDKKEKPAKEPSGPYAIFWRIMVVKGVKTYPDLQEKLDVTPEHVWDGLHAAFETETMSTVSPRVWEAWVTENGLNEGLITMSRNAEVQAAKG